MSVQDIIVGIISVGVLFYLLWALINPEKL
jgi:K+-transporting ATPase KdpF subunit